MLSAKQISYKYHFSKLFWVTRLGEVDESDARMCTDIAFTVGYCNDRSLYVQAKTGLFDCVKIHGVVGIISSCCSVCYIDSGRDVLYKQY